MWLTQRVDWGCSNGSQDLQGNNLIGRMGTRLCGWVVILNYSAEDGRNEYLKIRAHQAQDHRPGVAVRIIKEHGFLVGYRNGIDSLCPTPAAIH